MIGYRFKNWLELLFLFVIMVVFIWLLIFMKNWLEPSLQGLLDTVNTKLKPIAKRYQQTTLPRQQERGKASAEDQVAHLEKLMQPEIKEALFIALKDLARVEGVEGSERESENLGIDFPVQRLATLTAISIVYTFNEQFPVSEIREKYLPWEWIDELIQNIAGVRLQKKQ